jgi:hypothetical protein
MDLLKNGYQAAQPGWRHVPADVDYGRAGCRRDFNQQL